MAVSDDISDIIYDLDKIADSLHVIFRYLLFLILLQFLDIFEDLIVYYAKRFKEKYFPSKKEVAEPTIRLSALQDFLTELQRATSSEIPATVERSSQSQGNNTSNPPPRLLLRPTSASSTAGVHIKEECG